MKYMQKCFLMIKYTRHVINWKETSKYTMQNMWALVIFWSNDFQRCSYSSWNRISKLRLTYSLWKKKLLRNRKWIYICTILNTKHCNIRTSTCNLPKLLWSSSAESRRVIAFTIVDDHTCILGDCSPKLNSEVLKNSRYEICKRKWSAVSIKM